jgi:PAS domain S-box-containing protein
VSDVFNRTSARLRSQLRAAPAYSYFAAVILVGGLLAFFLTWTYKEIKEDAQRSFLNESTILATRVESTLRRVRATSAWVATQLADSEWPRTLKTEGSIDLDPQLVALRNDFPEVASLTVFDAHGRIALGSDPRPANLSIADIAYFIDAAHMQQPELRFSDALTARSTGRANLFAYQPILSSAGVFRGVVVMPLDLEYFADLFRQVKTGDGGMVLMRRLEDSRLVLRWPSMPSAINTRDPDTPVYRALQSGKTEGVAELRSPLDGTQRLAGYRAVTGFPFFVVVGGEGSAIFRAWRTSAIIASTAACLALAVVGMLLWFYRRQERARRVSDRRYRAIVDEQRDAICRYLPDTTLTFANATYRRYFERPGTNVIGQKWLGRMPSTLGGTPREAVERMLVKGEAFRLETWEQCPDGERRCLEWVGAPLRDEAGNLVEFQSVGRDITQQKLAIERMADSEQRLRLAFAAAGQGWFDLDLQKGVATESASCAQLLGGAPHESRITFDEWMQTIHPDDRAAVAAVAEFATAGDELPRREYRRRARDGSWRWLMSIGNVVNRSADGAPLRVVGIHMDITDRKRDEDLLLESEHRFRTIANSGSALVWTSDADGTTDFYNDRTLQFTGRSQEQLRGNGWLEVLHPDDRARSIRNHLAAVETREAFSIEFRVLRADGEYRWFRNDAMPRYDSTGNFLGFIGSGMDITDAKNAAVELEAHRTNLEQLVRERTAELIIAKAHAEAANLAKSAFLANMSHEIRTPLNAITGMAHILKREGVTPTQAIRLERIDVAGKHLLELINAVLELSKIEAGKFDLREEAVDIEQVVEAVTSLLRERAAGKGLHLVAAPLNIHRLYLGDAMRLREALLNYVVNAIKFTEVGTITVRVAVADESNDRVTVRFEVQDTGIGIAAVDTSRLFSAFEQVDNTSSRNFGGSGLGLAITKRLAQLMGGDAGVVSTLGSGSTFWFTARLKRADKPDQPRGSEDHPSLAAVLTESFAGKRVLLVEDDAINLEIGNFLLADVGLVVDSAHDGIEAVKCASMKQYDLILMDVQMPRLGGLEATRRIRQLLGYADVPVIALTASAFNEDRARCLDAGMNDYIAKPVEPEVLFHTLLRWMRGPVAIH